MKSSLARISSAALVCFAFFSGPAFAQVPSVTGTPAPGLGLGAGAAGNPPSIDATGCESSREVTLRKLVPNIACDQRPIWTFPKQLAKGKHLKPFLFFSAATVALIATDPYSEPYFRNSPTFNNYKVSLIRGRNTSVATASLPLAFYLVGQATGDTYARNTGLLAGEAMADAFIADYALKGVFGRMHPSDFPVRGDFSDSWWRYPGPIDNPGSFPSGHSTLAFAVASIFSRRYPRHKWVPWVVYGATAAIGFSRVPDRAHFASDVFAGAVLGWEIGHFVPMPDAGMAH